MSARLNELTPRTRWIVAAGAVFVVTVVLRVIGSATAYDVFQDEVIYTRIADGVATDASVRFGDFPFLLHGPLVFGLWGGLIDVFGLQGTAIQLVHHIRIVNAFEAGVVGALVLALVSRVTSLRWGLLAAAVFALDPFIVRFDGRAFLETTAMLWTVAGFLVLLPLASGTSKSPRRAIAAGVLFGLALLSKETGAPLYAFALLWCLVRSTPVPRRLAARTSIAAFLVYLPYPVIVLASGDGDQLVDQKLDGVLRLLGLRQDTGFNREGGPSLVSRITAQLDTFAGTYVLIALGLLALVYVARRGGPAQRLVSLWAAGAFLLLGFQVVQGTLEEQMFYWLVVPSLAVGAVAASLAWPRLATRPSRAVAAAGFAALILFGAVTWVGVRGRDDTAIADTIGWVQSNVPSDTRVAPLVDGSQYLLPQYVLTSDPEGGVNVTPAALRASRSRFVLTSSEQVEQGYSTARPALVDWLRANGRVRHVETAPTAGRVTVWELGTRSSPDGPAPGAETLDPSTPISRPAAR
jgi:hypothetical protein